MILNRNDLFLFSCCNWRLICCHDKGLPLPLKADKVATAVISCCVWVTISLLLFSTTF